MAVELSGETETTHLLKPTNKIPKDTYHIAYIIYFTIGVGYLLPWNAFITAVDYFAYLYPNTSIDRTFAIVYMLVGLICLLFILAYAHKSTSFVRINAGFVMFVLALVVVPLMDVGYVKGRVGVFEGFYVAVGAVAVCGIGDALVQGSIIGAAGEMPERYMQAVVAGTGVSGVLVSLLRLLTKAIYPQDAHGLRKSANLYFMVSIAVMIICIVAYNVVHKLPVIKYYNDLKLQAIDEEKEDKQASTSVLWGSTLWDIVGTVKWYGYAILAIYVMTLCIFPGYITEDVHSYILNDWYPILLITGYNLFDLVGKSLTAIYMLGNAKVAIGASFARLLFLPLFYGCLHGPQFFRTEIPVTVLTCLLGLTNGYLTSVLMILGTKTVLVHHAETAGIVLVIFLVTGLFIGSVVSWFWVI
ncbi:equilibrative nucleotide transporter 1 [Apium graveolens]|uniref:equilibrative nucleotide transporter 1 n=1 Tax=Apium graveolens TaxID=4045 RepID=UPI003D797AB4